jgi:hypothetical protein
MFLPVASGCFRKQISSFCLRALSLYGINTTFLTYSIAAGAGGLLCESETPRSLRTDLGGGGIVSCADRRDRICVALHHSPEKQKVNNRMSACMR